MCSNLSRLLGGLVLFTAFLTASCGGPAATRLPESGATLEGKVTYGGEELKFAQIQVKTANASAIGIIGESGRYKVENAPVGDVHIGVNTEAARGHYMAKVQQASQGKAKGQHKFVDVPKKYFDPDESGLKTTVNKGPNTFDIVIPK